MDAQRLDKAIGQMKAMVLDHRNECRERTDDWTDVAELLDVLRRVVKGKPVARAFGSPGDWGYETPIGAALAAQGKTEEQAKACTTNGEG